MIFLNESTEKKTTPSAPLRAFSFCVNQSKNRIACVFSLHSCLSLSQGLVLGLFLEGLEGEAARADRCAPRPRIVLFF
jgi:hypothetical protein